MKPAGRNPERAIRALQAGTVTLCSQRKSSPFWIIVLLISGETNSSLPTPRAIHTTAPYVIAFTGSKCLRSAGWRLADGLLQSKNAGGRRAAHANVIGR
jgi:hypothetical protein